MPRLTTSSYAVLALLCVQPWSAYELTRQMSRSLSWFWPRAASGVYEEPKKLVAHGYAEASTQRQGRRSRTVYSVTPVGRVAMAAWLAEHPTDPPQLQSEQLLRVLLPDAGDRDLLLDNLDRFAAQIDERLDTMADQMRSYAGDDPPFPERRFAQLLAGGMIVSHLQALADWAAWAREQVRSWPGSTWAEAADGAAPALEDLVERIGRGDRLR